MSFPSTRHALRVGPSLPDVRLFFPSTGAMSVGRSAARLGDRRAGGTSPRLGYVPALDGVRALAVIAVLAFHGGMSWARGGFLGVDAFFVLSGFLITSLLLTEWERTGRIAIGDFWIRRARRLLPALLLMLAAVAIGARALLPPPEVRLLRGDGLAALMYVANWRMIFRGSDYFVETAAPSPLEHTWSLGIEEQFYLLWPLILVGLLVSVKGRRAALSRVLVWCASGAAVSAVLLMTLYRPEDLGRAYYGTDARGASLLIGAGLAALLARTSGVGDSRESEPSRLTRVLLGTAAGVAILALAWAWSRLDGGDARLYRGGLVVVALAVAVVLAHVVLMPGGWPARALSVRPLVLIGRISYGIYLWHWPMFIALNADRTGRHGVELFVLRSLATFGVAMVSYLLVERPVREGRLPRSLAAFAAPAAVAAVAALIFLSTSAPATRLVDAATLASVPQGAASGLDDLRAPSGPDHRDDEGRAVGRSAGTSQPLSHHPRPGRTAVVNVFGDSVAWSLVTYLPSHPGLDIRNRTILACGVARGGPYRYFGVTYPTVGPDCRRWPELWRRAIGVDDPDVALIMVGRWETMDRMYEGRWTHVGDPAFDAYLRSELELAIETAGSHGARVMLATEPYNRRGEQLDGSLYPEDLPERVTAWNKLLRDVAADHSGVSVLEFGDRVSPEGHFTWTAGGVQVRSDGLHLSPAGVADWIAPWLLPQLRAAVGR